MTGINTQMEFLVPPSNHMCEGGHMSLWEKANQIQHSSHQTQNSSVGNGSFPLFTPATHHLQGSVGPEAPLRTSLFQCANRANIDSLREPTDTCASAFQEINRGRNDCFENNHLHSSQNHLTTSHVFNSFESLHKASLLEKQKEKDSRSNIKTSSVSDSASAHPGAKRVPIFKAARSKAPKVPLLHENKAKKRLISSEVEPVKKHAGISSFNHSEISAFKPVVTNGTSETASVPSYSLLAEKSDHQNKLSGSHSKTLLRKPKFGKSHPSLNKIKEEGNSLRTKPGIGEENREGFHDILSSQPGERRDSMDKPQTETLSYSPSPLLKEELIVNEDNLDVTGTFDKEYESGGEDFRSLKPVQYSSPQRRMKKTEGKKKNVPRNMGNPQNKLNDSKINKKKCFESNRGKKQHHFQGVATTKNTLPGDDDIGKSSPQIMKEKTGKSQTTQFSETSHKHVVPSKKKKNPLLNSNSEKSTLSDTVKLKQRKKSVKKYASTYTAKQQMTSDLPGQMEKNTHQSSPVSHDTTESSMDSSYSRTSELSSCLGRERSLERNRYEEESSIITDEEITNHSEAVKESVLQMLNSMDRETWVQCDRCSKWRRLTHISDPATLPDKWFCSMLPVPGRNSCQEPEEDWNANESYIYYEHQFVVGSVVWAQVPGSPWWPAMVDIDPDYKRYDWFNSTWTYTTSYHVTFFGDPVMRAWVTCSNIRIFKQHDSYKKNFGDKKKDPTRDPLLRKAVEEASYALSMDVHRRRKKYTFVARYTGKIGRNSPAHNKSETSEVKTVPLKTFRHRKQRKESKGSSTAASTLAMKLTIDKPADTVGINDIRNISESPQDKEIRKHTDKDEHESRLESHEQDVNESFIKQNVNNSDSENDQSQMDKENEEDTRIGKYANTMNANNRETSERELYNTECSHDDQYTNMDEYQETATDRNRNISLKHKKPLSSQKHKKQVLSKMTKKKKISERYIGIEETIEKLKIRNENVASFEKNLDTNEVFEPDLQENEDPIDSVHGTDLQDNEDPIDNVYGTDLQDIEDTLDSVHGTDLQDIEDTLDSVHGTDLQDIEDTIDSVHGTDLQDIEDTIDSVHGTDLQDIEDTIDSVHGTDLQDIEDTIDSVHGTDLQDIEDTSDGVYGTDLQDIEDSIESEHGTCLKDDDAIDDVHGTDLQDHEDTESSYKEQDESDINYKQSDLESDEHYDTASNLEHDIENDLGGGSSKFVVTDDQDGSEDQYDEQVQIESNYESDTCTYEGQDNEGNCEGDEYTIRQNSEYNGGQNNEYCSEPPSNCYYDDDDSEQDNESAYEDQFVNDSEQYNESTCEGQDADFSEQDNEYAYEGQDIDDSGAVQHFDYENNENYEHKNGCD